MKGVLVPQIDNPVYVEITLGGDMKFVVVLDEEDDRRMFALALSKLTNKSIDWNPTSLEELKGR